MIADGTHACEALLALLIAVGAGLLTTLSAGRIITRLPTRCLLPASVLVLVVMVVLELMIVILVIMMEVVAHLARRVAIFLTPIGLVQHCLGRVVRVVINEMGIAL